MLCACRRRLRRMAQSASIGEVRMESTSGTAGGNLAWVARSDELRGNSREIAGVQWYTKYLACAYI